MLIIVVKQLHCYKHIQSEIDQNVGQQFVRRQQRMAAFQPTAVLAAVHGFEGFFDSRRAGRRSI
jgi:hypothetical protein